MNITDVSFKYCLRNTQKSRKITNSQNDIIRSVNKRLNFIRSF